MIRSPCPALFGVVFPIQRLWELSLIALVSSRGAFVVLCGTSPARIRPEHLGGWGGWGDRGCLRLLFVGRGCEAPLQSERSERGGHGRAAPSARVPRAFIFVRVFCTILEPHNCPPGPTRRAQLPSTPSETEFPSDPRCPEWGFTFPHYFPPTPFLFSPLLSLFSSYFPPFPVAFSSSKVVRLYSRCRANRNATRSINQSCP